MAGNLEDGWNILVGADKLKILDALKSFKPKMESYAYRFGDGKASERIVAILKKFKD